MKKYLFSLLVVILTIFPSSSQDNIVATKQKLQEGYESSIKQSQSYLDLSNQYVKKTEEHQAIAFDALKKANEYMNKSAECIVNKDKKGEKEYSKMTQEQMKIYQVEIRLADDCKASAVRYKRRSVDLKNLANHYQSILSSFENRVAE